LNVLAVFVYFDLFIMIIVKYVIQGNVSIHFFCIDFMLCIINQELWCCTLLVSWFFLVGKIAIFSFKRAQRCAHSIGTVKTGKEAGETKKKSLLRMYFEF